MGERLGTTAACCVGRFCPCPAALAVPRTPAAPSAPPGQRPAPPGGRQRLAAWSARPAAIDGRDRPSRLGHTGLDGLEAA
jgi:hypothetical protein